MPDHSANSEAASKPTSPFANSDTLRFGIFEFSIPTSELRRNGMLVRLQAQPARVLSYLLSHAGKIVSREELHDAIWGSSTFVDFERGLNVCIAQIRAALGDDSNTPRYIRTAPRKGYEFICPVQPVAAQSTPQAAEPVPALRSRHTLLVASVAALLLIAIAFGTYFANRARPHSSVPIIVAVARFDNETGDAQLDRFSDALTDDVVAQLTTSGKAFRIIGNAAALRVPRPQRNLVQIASELHANFVVLGQVQRIGSQTRILAHLIRLPEQTHVWVVRLDQPLDDPAAIEAAASRDIATQFSAKLANSASLVALHDASNR